MWFIPKTLWDIDELQFSLFFDASWFSDSSFLQKKSIRLQLIGHWHNNVIDLRFWTTKNIYTPLLWSLYAGTCLYERLIHIHCCFFIRFHLTTKNCSIFALLKTLNAVQRHLKIPIEFRSACSAYFIIILQWCFKLSHIKDIKYIYFFQKISLNVTWGFCNWFANLNNTFKFLLEYKLISCIQKH